MNNINARGIVWEEGDKNDDLLSHFLTTAIFYLVLLNPLIDLVSGFMAFVLGVPSVGMALRTMVIMFSALLVLVIPPRKSIPFIWFSMITFLLVLIRLVRLDVTIGKVAYDVHYLGRGYMYLLAVALFIYVLNHSSTLRLFKQYFIFLWVLVTVMVGLHALGGYGVPTYKTGEGFVSYFDSQNQVTFVYTSAWWVIVALYMRRWWTRLLFTCATLVLLLAIGTKTGFGLIFLMTGIYVLSVIYRKSRVLFVLTLFFCAGLVVIAIMNLKPIILWIIDFYINYSSVAEKFTRNEGLDPLAVITSQRTILTNYAMEIISRFNLKDVIMGIGLGNYVQELETLTHASGLTEVDTVDLMGGWGILGFFVFYGPFVFIFVRMLKRWSYVKAKADIWGHKRMPYALLGLTFMYVVASSVSGHIAFAPSPMIGMALLMVLGWRLSARED